MKTEADIWQKIYELTKESDELVKERDEAVRTLDWTVTQEMIYGVEGKIKLLKWVLGLEED